MQEELLLRMKEMPPSTIKPKRIQAVFDTNIIMAAHLTKNPRSPTRELLERWQKEEFELVYSTALLVEYQEKFKERLRI